jgi:hypothetical protein
VIAFRSLTRGAAFAGVLTLAACGGGGGGGVSTVPSTHPTTAPTPTGPTAQVTLRIDTSTVTTSSSRTRSPKFISPNTQSVTVALQGGPVLANVNITPSSPNCVNGTCSITLNAPVGTDTFVITTWDGPNGTGNQLSTATTVATVVQNATNTIAVALGGVVASATVILGSGSVPAGTAATVSVTVAAYDAQQNLIIGPGNYSSPVTLTNSDTSGVTHLSAAQITGPGATINLTYSGGSIAGATITPMVGSTAGTAATFAPSGYGFADFSVIGTNAGFIDSVAAGPDGKVWYGGDSGNIGNITPAGSQMLFNTGSGASTYGLATASNGVLWFGDDDGDLGTIATNGTGTVDYLTALTVLPNTNNCNGGNWGDAVARRSAQSGTPTAIACGAIEWMAPGPDGNMWFDDDAGFIGNVTPGGVATEWDVTQLPGWNGTASELGQFTFAPDGNIYVAEGDGFLDKITVGGGAATSSQTISSPVSCSAQFGPFGIGITADNTLWTGDDCSNLFAIPLGNPISAGNFNTSNVQSWSVTQISNGDSLGLFASTPAGVFAIDFASNVVYRVNEVAGTAPPQPAITTITQFSPSATTGEALAIGPDTNLWVGYTVSDGDSDPMARIAFGAPTVGTQSLLRSLPHATSSVGRNAAAFAKRHAHRPKRL